VIGALSNASRRFYFRQPGQLGLAIAGIALGVAVVVGIDLANSAARRAFELSGEIVMGGATHQLVAPVGRLPETVYRELRLDFGLEHVTPVIQGRLRIPALPGRSFTLLGIEPLTGAAFRNGLGVRSNDSIDLTAFISRPDTIILPEALALELDRRPADQQKNSLGVQIAGQPHTLRVVGLLDQNAHGFLWADIATAQELFEMTGYLTRIDLILTAEEAARVSQADLGAAILVATNTNRRTLDQMTRAFRINLAALSLLALVVGMFLIYATMSFAVVQRRTQTGTLLALGMTRRELLAATLLEALALGLVATTLGLILGQLLAQGLIQIILRTIQDLYFTTGVSSVNTDPFVFIKGGMLGIGATLLAAIAPALDAAHTPPSSVMRRASLERAMQKRVRSAAWLALPCILLAALILKLTATNLYAAFGGIFLIIVAGALLIPLITLHWLHLLARPAGKFFGIAGSLAMRGAAASLSRTGVAIAALSVAVTTVIGMGLMIGSFRASLDSWLDTTLLADFYVSVDDATYTTADDTFSPEQLSEIADLPGVTGLSLGRYTRIKTPTGELALRALRPGPRGWGIEIIAGDRAEALAKLAAGSAVLISEPLALRRGLTPAGQIELPTRLGSKTFDIAGVFRDYRTDGGSVLLDLDLYRRYWDDDRLNAVGVYTEEGHDSGSMQKALESALSTTFPARMTVVANKLIREASLAVFDRTFEITQVLRILAGIVAFLGILSALLALQLERIREAAILRALGFTPTEIAGQTLLQTTILGFTAGLFAIPSGIVLAALLVHVINARAFGWSMSLSVFPQDLFAGLAIATLAAFLAGIYPARRLARSVIARGLRNE